MAVRVIWSSSLGNESLCCQWDDYPGLLFPVWGLTYGHTY